MPGICLRPHLTRSPTVLRGRALRPAARLHSSWSPVNTAAVLSHALYLVSEIVHTAARIASHNSTTTLSIASSLYIYEPLLLGVLRGAAVNVSGEKVDDLPTADVSRGELHDLLSHKGRFVSSSTSDFVLDPSKAITSERAAKIATMSCDKLVAAANQVLVSFFESESRNRRHKSVSGTQSVPFLSEIREMAPGLIEKQEPLHRKSLPHG